MQRWALLRDIERVWDAYEEADDPLHEQYLLDEMRVLDATAADLVRRIDSLTAQLKGMA